MSSEGFTDQILQFEIRTLAAAERLGDLLADRRRAWIRKTREAAIVCATLNRDPLDLAVLLRTVESWVAEESLCAIRYELDGRKYVLAAGEPAWSVPVAA
jgi:hypothetical protein